MTQIFYVDDDKDDFYFFEQAIKVAAFPVTLTHVENGTQLLTLLGLNRHLPAIIFLDIRMPLIDGLEALESIRADETFEQIPIIIFSAMETPELVRLAYEKGAQLFLKKPDDFLDYQHIIESLFCGASNHDDILESYIRR